MLSKIKNFILEVRGEMRKVVWPTKQETAKYTIAVVAISLALAAFFGGLDYALTYLLDNYLLK